MSATRLTRAFFVSTILSVVAAAGASDIVRFGRPLAAQGNPGGGVSTSCEALASRTFPDATITLAKATAPGTFTPPDAAPTAKPNPSLINLPAFCRVAATLKPSADSDIKIEIWLPASNWNGKFQAVGNGGWAGSINYASMGEALKRGYATSSTDSGHVGGGGPWMQRPEKLADFGYRAVHEMTVKSKAIAAMYYGSGPKLSYFNGCSGGGRQGLVAAQRFPEDFDGIVAGAPAVNTTGRAAFAMWIAQAMHRDEAAYIPPSKYALVHDAALNACDANDGVKDGVLENPRQCHFDPKVLTCTGNDSANCLTAPQVESARANYLPLVNPGTKREISPGLVPGSERGWATYGSPQPFGLGAQMFQHMVFKDPNWDYKTLNFDRDMTLTDTIENGLIDVTEPDLKRYFDRRGKIIHYHGWADPQITPLSSVKYYESVVEAAGGADRVSQSYRLFMVPGMAHCGGGDGTSTFDMVGALEQWVEQGNAPEQISAARVRNGTTDRTRPLCPYPQVAKYSGSGNTDEARSFSCGR